MLQTFATIYTSVPTHDINHDTHIPTLGLGHQVLQIIGRSKVVIELVDIQRPVPMVSFTERRVSSDIRDNGRDPNHIKSHSFNVVELAGQTLVRTSTVARGIHVTSLCG